MVNQNLLLSLLLALTMNSLVRTQAHRTTRRLGVIYSPANGQVSESRVESVINNFLLSRPATDGPLRLVWHRYDDLRRLRSHVCDLIASGIDGLVSVIPANAERMVKTITNQLCIPHVALGMNQPVKGDNSTSTLSAPASHLARNRLIVDLVLHAGWKHVGIMMDEAVEWLSIRDIVVRLSAASVEVTIGHTDLQDLNIPKPEPKYWIFVGSADSFNRSIMQMPELHGINFRWVLLVEPCQCIDSLLNYRRSRPTIVILRHGTEPSICLTSFPFLGIRSLCCTDLNLKPQESRVIEAILLLSEKNGYTRPDTDRETDHCLDLSASLGSPCPDLWKNESLMTFGQTTYDIYEMKSDQTSMIKIGRWDTKSGLDLPNNGIFDHFGYSFGNRTLLIAATEAPPLVMGYIEGGVKKYKGFSIDIMDEIASKMRFTYTIVEPPDDFYGAPNEDGSWNGMVGMVHRKEVEMAIGPFTITSKRQAVIDFTKPFSEGSTGIITRSPGYNGGKSLFQTLRPFSTGVWLTILGLLVVTSFVSYIANKFTPTRQSHFSHKSFVENCWMVYASITEQGIEEHPQALSGRCVLGFWWLFTIVTVAAFTANLTAVLTVFIPSSPISSLSQLLGQQEIQPIVQAGTSFQTLFQNSSDPVYQEIQRRLEGSPQIGLQSRIMDLVETGKYAFIADRVLTDYIASLNCQTFAVAEQSFDTVGYGIVIPKRAPYTDTINFLIIKMQEAGLIDKWRRRWWPLGDCRKKQNVPTSLDLDSLGGIFMIYLGSAFISFLWNVGEVTWRSYRQKTDAA